MVEFFSSNTVPIIGAILVMFVVTIGVLFLMMRKRNEPESYTPVEPWKQGPPEVDFDCDRDEEESSSSTKNGRTFFLRRNGELKWEEAQTMIPGFFPNGAALVITRDGNQIRKKMRNVRVS